MPNQARLQSWPTQMQQLFRQSASALQAGHLEQIDQLNRRWVTLLQQVDHLPLTPAQRGEWLLMHSKQLSHRSQYEELSQRLEEAEHLYQQAIEKLQCISQIPNYDQFFPAHHLRLLIADGYGFLTGLYRRQARRAEAYRTNQLALDALPPEPPPDDVGHVTYVEAYLEAHNTLALLLTDDKRHEEAAVLYEQLLAFAQQHHFVVGEVQTLNNLGVLAYWRSFGQDNAGKAAYYRQAETYFNAVRELNQQRSPTHFLNAVTDEVNLGTLYCGMKRYDQALNHLDQALTKLDRYADEVSGPDRLRLRENQAFCEQMMVSALVNNRQSRNAFLFLEKRRSRQLTDSHVVKDPKRYPFQSNDIRTILASDEAFVTFSNTDQDKFVVLVVRAGWTAALEIIYYDHVEELYTKYRPQIDQLLSTKTRFTQQLPSDTNQPLSLQKRYKNYTLLRLIHWFRLLLERRDLFDLPLIKQVAQQFYALLIAPIVPYLTDVHQLQISTDASLGLLPFEVLCDANQTYLIEQYLISYTRTLNHVAYFRQRSEGRTASKPLLIVKNSVYVPQQSGDETELTPEERRQILIRYHRNELTNDDFQRLHGRIRFPGLEAVETEVGAIRQAVPRAELLTISPLTKQTFLEAVQAGTLAGYQQVHLALHGIAYPDMPQLSSLLFYHPEPTFQNTFLTIREIEKLAIKADFVTVAACETGVGGISQVEGMVGVAQTLLKSGADSVLSALWEVDSANTAQFMKAFYCQLAQTGTYAETLRALKLDYMRHSTYRRHPAFWAGFVLHGLPARPPKLTS